MKIGLRALNAYLKSKGRTNEECTRKGKTFYWLHICSNGVPVPLYSGKDPKDLMRELKIRMG